MGNHARPSHRAKHRKPPAPYRAAALTASAATATASAGAIVAVASTGHAATAPQAQLAAHVVPNVQAQQLHVVNVTQPPAVQLATVESGNTLSGIAKDKCGAIADWTGIYMKNKKTIGSNPDLILPGQVLALDCRTVNVPVVTAATSYVRHAKVYAVTPRKTYHAPVSASYAVSSNFQACVIRAESGGNPDIWNASGHWGLYQFSSSTWAAHGGNPADFGHASAAEQTQVFWRTVHDDGVSDWAPYDGC